MVFGVRILVLGYGNIGSVIAKDLAENMPLVDELVNTRLFLLSLTSYLPFL